MPDWVPDGATEIKEVQRTTGHERIFTLTLDGPLPDSCLPVTTPGRPSAEEIAEQLHAHAAFRAVTEVAFALPFSFADEDYEQMLTDIATRLGPALGWQPRP